LIQTEDWRPEKNEIPDNLLKRDAVKTGNPDLDIHYLNNKRF
jgi:hypothetical protein